ncbi:hypothetical protein CEXT_62861 [Caerostris extrusa]|uniref:Uncharacterized protein n=1 Tax=Caerostris extrusa TaxID=172846 RepID=A0AAV4XLT9_CAEEX|nr:hypothetical protein CEXT_62861 [Caerostris extrusa]
MLEVREVYRGRHKSDAPEVKGNNNNGVTEEKVQKYIIMESQQTVAEGREGGVNSKSFRTSERRNAPKPQRSPDGTATISLRRGTDFFRALLIVSVKRSVLSPSLPFTSSTTLQSLLVT